MNTTNILTHTFSTPFESAPFSQIKQEDFEPAILELINQSKTEIANIVNQSELPNFKNTIEALEASGKQLNRATAIFFNLNSAETNDYLEQVAQKLSPALAAYSNDIMLNATLFNKIKKVYDVKDTLTLTHEQKRLLDKTYKSFVRNGALLSETDKERLRNIDQELSMLSVQFSQNVLAETNSYYLHITDEKDLDGLPTSVIEMAKGDAKARNLNGWVFTLQFPSITSFLKYSKNRALRQQLHLASGKKGLQDNAYNNTEIIKKIVTLKHQRAQLLGFEDHASFILEERMAGDKNTVLQFLEELLVKAQPFAHKEIEQLKALAKKDGINNIQAYDHAYYAELLKEEMYSISDELLKPYFPLQQVLNAAFDVATKLYGLYFQKRTDIDTYHEEVEVYEVLENGKHKALLYTDFFPRAGKRPGAWMTSYKDQYIDDCGNNHRPHISIVCNFSRPIADTPSLLTFTEVTTLFHEFGHALHGILANTTYESLSGTNVYWDFVELPSQFMENFCFEPEFLKSFAKHYQTGEVLSDALIEKIVASANFMQGYQTLRQLGFGILDMKYHTNQYSEQQDIETFEKDAIKGTILYPNIEGTAMSTSFSHIFAGGYAAGYYSYKWAEVLDADAFAYFKENGIFDTITAQKFKILLSSGGTVDPMDLYINFRGRKPDVNALLKRAGIA
jgi:peptidyl-dipeptidase Dcp